MFRYDIDGKWEALGFRSERLDLQRVHGLLPAIYVRIEETELIRSVSAAEGFSFGLTMNWRFVFSPLAKSRSQQLGTSLY